MKLSLHAQTVKLLENTNINDWKPLADKCGLTTQWIRQLIDGTIKEPGANKLQALYLELGGEMGKL